MHSRILVVDDHPMMRESIASVLHRNRSWKLCGEAASIADARQLIPELRPDLVISDLSLPGGNGLTLMHEALSHNPTLRFLVLSMHKAAIHAEASLRAGARGYVMKGDSAQLIAAINEVLAGGISVDRKVGDRVLAAITQPQNGNPPLLSRLSIEEAQILEHLAERSPKIDERSRSQLNAIGAKLDLPPAAVITFALLLHRRPRD